MITSPLILLLSIVAAINSSPPLNCSKLERLRAGDNVFQAMGDKFDDFDWNLSKEINGGEGKNMVISPISVKVVLAMLYEGAGGQTAREIGDALDLTNSSLAKRANSRQRFSNILKSLQTSKGEYEIKIGTHVFIDKKAEPKEMYICKLQHYYSSNVEKVDFSDTKSAVAVINNWAKNVTEGHIQHLVSEAEDHSNTIMLLLNAVYFKGLWQVPFPENQTKQSHFHLSNNQMVEIPLMNTTGRFAYYNLTDIDAQLIRLPYLGDKFAMYVLLPNNKTGLNKLIKTLGPNKSFLNYIGNMTTATVNLLMPKFEFDFTTSLRPTLEKLGLKSMFSPGAELSDIAESKTGSLVVSNVLQKAGISVTEIGTVAYAATTVELMDKFGGDEETVEFKVDHPFLFFIEDESVRTTVFVGKVTNPEKAAVRETGNSATPPMQCVGTMCSPDNKIGEPSREPGQNGAQKANHARFNFFDADLLKEVASIESENFVVSPASIKSLLGLVVEAAEGSTLTELLTLLRLPQNLTDARQMLGGLQSALQKNSNSKVAVDSISQVFISKALSSNTKYAATIKDHYRAEVSPEDFMAPEVAANHINSWVSSRTRGLIPTLIEPGMIHSDTYAILASAIYFDGKWKTQFMPKDTKEACFYSGPNLECHLVQMMAKSEDLFYKYDGALNSHVLKIPYEDPRFFMVIVLPQKKDGMKQLTIETARLSFPALLHGMKEHDVNLKMPSFTVEYSTELTNVLKAMGLVELFSPNAQLPYMIYQRQGKVSAIIHKAKIEVSDKGTKAAAASGAEVVPLSYGLDVINIVVDHPFYYFVCEQESQSVLFAGRLSSINSAPLRQPVASASSGKPSPDGTQNYQYVPSSTTKRYYSYTKEPIHFRY